MELCAVIDSKGKSHSLQPGKSLLEQWNSERLRASYVALKCQEKLLDLSCTLQQNHTYTLISRDSSEGLSILRHDAAHIMAQAVTELFPDTQVTIGPAIENGFYYDFARSSHFSPEDFPRIEQRMHQIVDQDIPLVREVWSRQQALEFFQEKGEHYKCQIIESIPHDEPLTVYRQGSFVDLCRGPHLPSTGWLGHHFKIMKLAGAYWRGDHRNPMLQRFYGTAWDTDKALKAYLQRLEDAEKRDHRKLGQDMHLFSLSDAAPGSVFWQERGWTLYLTLEGYIRRKITHHGYKEIRTPQVCSSDLWKKSGHWEKFGHNMFACTPPQDPEQKSTEDKNSALSHASFALKPMNCPCHVHMFNMAPKSYRDLPLRWAEFGTCARYEPSGALHGLTRLRTFTQDDAHIFCTAEQLLEETVAFCTLLEEVYQELGFPSFQVKLATRPQDALGDPQLWSRAEEALAQGARKAGLTYTINPGEGAFYGPKLEFVLQDAVGRDWQCGTLQADFILPQRLEALYTGPDGQRHVPVMLHRAILGSLERFIAVMLEHHTGRLPLWLMPVQVAVANINQESLAYAEKVFHEAKRQGLRCVYANENDTLNYKIRLLSSQKVPIIFIVGEKEAREGTVGVRRLGSTQTTTFPLAEALATIKQESCAPDQ